MNVFEWILAVLLVVLLVGLICIGLFSDDDDQGGPMDGWQ